MRAPALVALAAVAAAGCGFHFDRTLHVAPGEISGLAVRLDDDKKPAPFAHVAIQGGSLVRRTANDGAFAIRGLTDGPWIVRFTDDANNDGKVDRTAFSAARIVTASDGKLSSVLLGNVGLDGTFDITGSVDVVTAAGSVPPATVGLLGRVVLTRELCVPAQADAFTLACSAGAPADRISVGVEAEAGVDVGGGFALPGNGSGTVFLYPLLFAPSQGTSSGLGALVAVGKPVEIDGHAGENRSPPALTVDPVADAAAPVSATIALTPAPSDDVRLLFSIPGARPSCTQALGPDVIEIDVAHGAAATANVAVDAPPGILDVTACAGAASGFLAEALIVPPVDAADPATLGPILLRDTDPCGSPRDCDGDGDVGLPPLVFGAASYAADLATWHACAPQCATAFGSSSATCATPAGTFDCDDDGDGQPDVTESPQCYGLGLGTDLDGDGLCSGADPFPTCAANDAAQCTAGKDTPSVVNDPLANICEAEPAIPVPTCAFLTANDESADEDFANGPNDDVETEQFDANLNLVRFSSTLAGTVQLADHDIFLPNGNFTWTRNDLHVGFFEYEIWLHFDGAGRLTQASTSFDDDNDGIVDRQERLLFVPGKNSVEQDTNGHSGAGPRVAAQYDSDTIDCKPTRARYFSYDDDGVLSHIDSDDDADGVVDRSADAKNDGGCDAGPPCTETVTIALTGDPSHVIKVTKNAAGRVVHSESDVDGDGLFEGSVDFSPTDDDVRAGVDPAPRVTAVEFDFDGDGIRERHRDFTYDQNGQLATQVTLVDNDGDGQKNDARNEVDEDPIVQRPLRTKSQGDVSVPRDGVFDFTDVNTLATVPFGTPRFPMPTAFQHADDATENFTVNQIFAQADGCHLDAAVAAAPCHVDADCGAVAAGTTCNLLAPAKDASVEGFSLAAFCAPPQPGGAFGAACTGAAFNNPACASGLCDDKAHGACTAFCNADVDCAAGDVCVGVNGFGIAGAGYCAAPCALQQNCGGAAAGRSCVVATHHGDGVAALVCDGDRGPAPPGQPAFTPSPFDCSTHLMLSATSVCTEICAVPADCSFAATACTAGAAEDPVGPAATTSVCVP